MLHSTERELPISIEMIKLEPRAALNPLTTEEARA